MTRDQADDIANRFLDADIEVSVQPRTEWAVVTAAGVGLRTQQEATVYLDGVLAGIKTTPGLVGKALEAISGSS